MSKQVHRTEKILLESPLKTTITVIGAGGTGSHLIEGLAMLNEALVQLGHNGLHVSVHDDDIVEQHNIGRQLFGWGDIKQSKATATIARINRMYGLKWRSSSSRMELKPNGRFDEGLGNIVITTVDNGKTRNEMDACFKLLMAKQKPTEYVSEHTMAKRTFYWLDIGNDDRYGQFVLSSGNLPTCVDRFGPYSEVETGPSCSALESLQHQDLFINRIMADHALNLLWDLFRRGYTDKCGGFINLRTGNMRPIPVT